MQLTPFLISGEGECEIHGMNLALLESLQAYMLQSGQVGVWEMLR
jgi:hypothetical protein